MARQSYVQDPVTHELIPKDQYHRYTNSHMVWGDLPDFVSPIDGKTYSGRAGLREHCKVHDVVPTADLAGLPSERPKQKINCEEIRRTLADVAYGRIPVMKGNRYE